MSLSSVSVRPFSDSVKDLLLPIVRRARVNLESKLDQQERRDREKVSIVRGFANAANASDIGTLFARVSSSGLSTFDLETAFKQTSEPRSARAYLEHLYQNSHNLLADLQRLVDEDAKAESVSMNIIRQFILELSLDKLKALLSKPGFSASILDGNKAINLGRYMGRRTDADQVTDLVLKHLEKPENLQEKQITTLKHFLIGIFQTASFDKLAYFRSINKSKLGEDSYFMRDLLLAIRKNDKSYDKQGLVEDMNHLRQEYVETFLEGALMDQRLKGLIVTSILDETLDVSIRSRLLKSLFKPQGHDSLKTVMESCKDFNLVLKSLPVDLKSNFYDNDRLINWSLTGASEILRNNAALLLTKIPSVIEGLYDGVFMNTKEPLRRGLEKALGLAV